MGLIINNFGNIIRSRIVKKIQVPAMINVGGPHRIMQSEVSVNLFKQVMRDYEIEDHDYGMLQKVLNDPSRQNSSLDRINMLDAYVFAERLSNLTHKKFRVPTMDEWLGAKYLIKLLEAKNMVKQRLLGDNWEWTCTSLGDLTDDYSATDFPYVMCSLHSDEKKLVPGVARFPQQAVRLIEDL